MENMENIISEVPAKKKSNTKTVIAIILAGIIPAIFDLLQYIVTDVFYSFYSPLMDLLYNIMEQPYPLISALMSGVNLIFNALSVIIVSVVCAILLKSVTKGVAAYGCAIIVFSLRGLVLSIINTFGAYGIYNAAKYILTILSPVFICLLFFLFDKIKEKKALSKKKFTLKMIIVCLLPIIVYATMEMVLSILSTVIFAAVNSTEQISAFSNAFSIISAILSVLFSIAVLIVFIIVFRDGYSISAAIACTTATISLLASLNNVVYNICYAIILNLHSISWIGVVNIVLDVIVTILNFILPIIPIVLLVLIPSIRNRKKMVPETEETHRDAGDIDEVLAFDNYSNSFSSEASDDIISEITEKEIDSAE